MISDGFHHLRMVTGGVAPPSGSAPQALRGRPFEKGRRKLFNIGAAAILCPPGTLRGFTSQSYERVRIIHLESKLSSELFVLFLFSQNAKIPGSDMDMKQQRFHTRLPKRSLNRGLPIY